MVLGEKEKQGLSRDHVCHQQSWQVMYLSGAQGNRRAVREALKYTIASILTNGHQRAFTLDWSTRTQRTKKKASRRSFLDVISIIECWNSTLDSPSAAPPQLPQSSLLCPVWNFLLTCLFPTGFQFYAEREPNSYGFCKSGFSLTFHSLGFPLKAGCKYHWFGGLHQLQYPVNLEGLKSPQWGKAPLKWQSSAISGRCLHRRNPHL